MIIFWVIAATNLCSGFKRELWNFGGMRPLEGLQSACRGHCTSPLILSMQCLLARKAWVYCFCYNICSIGSFSLGSHQVPDEFVQLLQLLHLQIYIWSSHWLVTSCWHKLLPPMIAQLWKARWMTFYTYSVTPRLICKTVRGWNSFWTDILSPKKDFKICP